MVVQSPTESSHLSTASPPLCKRSPSPSPAPTQADGPKKQKRKGRVVSVLRQQLAPEAVDRAVKTNFNYVRPYAKPVISPVSTGSLMERAELRSALNHHLITLAWQSVEELNFPLWVDLSSALDNLRQSLLSGSTSLTTQVQVASLICLSARRSNHSALTGLPDQHSTGGAVGPVGLGRRRERACVALLERAIELSDEAGAFKLATTDSIRTLSLLRIAVMSSSPRHPVMLDVVSSLRAYYLAGVGSDLADSVIASDASTAILFGRAPALNPSELTAFGWAGVDIPALHRKLDGLGPGATLDHATILALRAYVVYIFRLLATSQSKGWSPSNVDSLPLPARPVIDELCVHAMAIERATLVLKALPAVSDLQVFTKLQHNNELFKLPVFIHSTIINLVTDLVQTTLDPDGEALLIEAQVRYLKWMRLFIDHISSTVSGSGDILTQSLLLDGLELLPNWLQLALDGARQTSAGEGPLAPAHFSWDHLRRLHKPLKLSTQVFASSHVHEQELARQLSVLDLTGGEGARPPREDVVAERMLHSALNELLVG